MLSAGDRGCKEIQEEVSLDERKIPDKRVEAAVVAAFL